MRTRFVVIALLVGLVSLVPGALMGRRSSPQTELAVRQKFQVELFNLERNLAKEHLLKNQLKLVDRSQKTLSILRGLGARQSDLDESFFDRVLAVLAEISRSEDFRASLCPEYKAGLILRYNPVAEASAQLDPAVTSGLKILRQICRKK